MTGPICFLDTETTGLSLDDDIWEIAAIRRGPDGTERELHLFVDHDEAKCARLPEAFLSDHHARYPHDCTHRHGARAAINTGAIVTRGTAAEKVAKFTRGAHIVGAVPNFDTERIAILFDRHGLEPGWHYHLIDVESLAVGYLAAKGTPWAPPWKSDDLSRACGVETPPDDLRHTAMGDARWAMALYDGILGMTP